MKARIDTRNGEALFSSFVPDAALPSERLIDLITDRPLGRSGPSASGLEQRLDVASRTPLNALACGQVRMLVGQKIGLKWLARPVALFVAAHPMAECDLCPGDLTVNALRALDDLMIHAFEETRLMIAADFSVLEGERAEAGDDALLLDALGALGSAREALGVVA
ncbi:hypothetical protein [Brevundimonas sp. M20]|uniref:hypothetical protein n=1 Tax=Brevundimonas sp. M20 TaxID=2591463 RepID=UPI00114645B3|nr:hypothetical protein [Brevundimonas sp. M20]QDH73111.1 hypothetical protein FKQ52_06525 [Brevundimonas sp. M20]